MKIAKCTLVALSIMASSSAVAENGFQVLHRQGPWTVFIFKSETNDPPTYCSAKSGDVSAYFELIGLREVSCLSAEAEQWKFRSRKAGVGFGIGISTFFVGSGQYFSNGLQICGPNDVIDLLINTIWTAEGRTIDVYDQKKRKIGSFPGAGREKALRVWKRCRDAL